MINCSGDNVSIQGNRDEILKEWFVITDSILNEVFKGSDKKTIVNTMIDAYIATIEEKE